MSTPINISASRGIAVLGLPGGYKTEVEVWLEIMEARKPGFCADRNYTMPEPPDNDAIDWGNAFETAVIYKAEELQRLEISDREKFLQKGFMTCHLDGVYKNGTVHEGKTTNYFYWRDNFGESGTNRIPRAYQVQVQHQMMLAEAEKCILSVLVFPKRQGEFDVELDKIDTLKWIDILHEMGYFHQYFIDADKDLQNLMYENYQKWWEAYVILEKEPPAVSYSDFALLINEPFGTIIADDQVERWASEYKQINAETLEMSKQKDQLKVLLLDYMKKQNEEVEKIIDDDSREKWILRDQSGKKLFQYNGKTLR